MGWAEALSIYGSSAPAISYPVDLTAPAAGILAAEAYHAALVRTVLYRKGIATPALQLIETPARSVRKLAGMRFDGAQRDSVILKKSLSLAGGF